MAAVEHGSHVERDNSLAALAEILVRHRAESRFPDRIGIPEQVSPPPVRESQHEP